MNMIVISAKDNENIKENDVIENAIEIDEENDKDYMNNDKDRKDKDKDINDIIKLFESGLESVDNIFKSDDPFNEFLKFSTKIYEELSEAYNESNSMCSADDSIYDNISNFIRQVQLIDNDFFKDGFDLLKENQCDPALIKYALSSLLKILFDSPDKGRAIFLENDGHGISILFSILYFYEDGIKSLPVIQVATSIIAGLTLDFNSHKYLIKHNISWLTAKLLRESDIDHTVHANCMMLLWTLATNDEIPLDSVKTTELIAYAFASMKKYPVDRIIHERAFGYLVMVLRNETLSRSLTKLNGVYEILNSMKTHNQSPHIQEQGCRTLIFSILANVEKDVFIKFYSPIESIIFNQLIDTLNSNLNFSKGPCISSLWHLSELFMKYKNEKDILLKLDIPKTILSLLTNHKNDPILVENGCSFSAYLLKIGKPFVEQFSNNKLPKLGDEIIFYAMIENKKIPALVEQCIDALVHYIHDSDENEKHLFSLENNSILNFIETTINDFDKEELKYHELIKDHVNIKERLIALIWKLGKNEGHRKILSEKNIEFKVLNEMNKYPKDVRIQTAGCLALWNLSYGAKDNKLIKKNADDTILAAMRVHENEVMLNQCGLGLLMQFSNPMLNNKKRLIEKKVIPLIESTIEKFQSNQFLTNLGKNTIKILQYSSDKEKH